MIEKFISESFKHLGLPLLSETSLFEKSLFSEIEATQDHDLKIALAFFDHHKQVEEQSTGKWITILGNWHGIGARIIRATLKTHGLLRPLVEAVFQRWQQLHFFGFSMDDQGITVNISMDVGILVLWLPVSELLVGLHDVLENEEEDLSTFYMSYYINEAPDWAKLSAEVITTAKFDPQIREGATL